MRTPQPPVSSPIWCPSLTQENLQKRITQALNVVSCALIFALESPHAEKEWGVTPTV